MAESELFDRGLQARRDVLGAEYVDANLADTDEFMMAFQRVVTEWAWGTHGAGQVWIARHGAC
jgi:4-carboxymuconolactone decarboxylase